MDPKISFEELESMNEVNLDLRAKDFSKQGFWHYTNSKSLHKIFGKDDLDDYTILCNRISKMNDLEERERANADNVFVTCFCNTNSEKIPMWFLYGSLNGSGVSIGLTPLNMLELLKSIKYVYGVKDNRHEKIGVDQLEIKYGWVYYRKTERGKTKFNFKGVFLEVFGFDDRRNDCYFIKDYVWNYEKEFRIVIEDKLKREFDKLFLPIPEQIAKEMKLKKGKKCDISDVNLPMSSNKIKDSDLKIDIDLIARNEDEILSWLDDEKSKKAN